MSFIIYSSAELYYYSVSILKKLPFYIILPTHPLKYLDQSLKLHISDSREKRHRENTS